MRWIGKIAVLAVMSASFAGCASNARLGDSAGNEPFSGTWAVRWCNKARPDLECGGFWVTLVQTGRQVCGEYGGALVNFRQVDEGRMSGVADGDSAVLKVRSDRNESLLEVEAERQGANLRWKALRDIDRGNGDISIIAFDNVLEPHADTTLLSPGACGV